MKHVRLYGLLVTILFCVGCTSLQDLLNEVDYSDGINTSEAILLAKNQLSQSLDRKKYRAKSAGIMSNYFVKVHPDYWFVSFDAQAFDMTFWKYLVVINKQTGSIPYSGAHIPLEVKDYDWVFKPEGERPF